MPLIDLQKSSNTVALVESFLGEFKPDDEGTTELTTQDKSNLKDIDANKEESVVDQCSKKPFKEEETLINNSQVFIKLEHISNELLASEPNSVAVISTLLDKDNSDIGLKPIETLEESVLPVAEEPPLPPTPPPPVKRKVQFLELFFIIKLL